MSRVPFGDPSAVALHAACDGICTDDVRAHAVAGRLKAASFDTGDVWPFARDWHLHPLHYIALGVVMIPLSLWEIFLLEPREKHDGK